MDRERLVDGALVVVEREGDQALSIRGLARDLGVSAPALYEYIESRDDLLRLMAQRGYEDLANRWRSIEGRAVDWLLQTARAYVDYAVEHPNLFTLMHRYAPEAIIGDPGVEHPAATVLFEEGLGQVQVAITAGDLREGDPLDLAVALWAAAHGVATVAITAPGVIDHTELTDLVVGSLLEAWRPSR